MSISSLTNTRSHVETRSQAAKRSNLSELSFQERLAQASAVIEGPAINLRMPNENTVYSGSHAGRNNTHQEIYAEYTAESTPEDPIVRITGTSDSGPYAFTRHVHDIDPSNASYAELAALYGHLVKSGAYRSGLSDLQIPHVLPNTMECQGDVIQKHDFIRAIQESLFNQPSHLDTAAAGASELLALYLPYASGNGDSRNTAFVSHSAFMKEDLLSALNDAKISLLNRMKLSKEKADEREDWERLMEYVDAWIETLREEASIEKIARAYADLKAAEADAAAGRKDLGDHLLDQLAQRLA